MLSTRFERAENRNIRIHVLPTDRFKTYAVSLYLGVPLVEETVTRNAILPFVLRRGTESCPDTRKYREKLDDLYGAGFGFDIYKRGNNQIVQFRMDTVADRYINPSSTSLLEETLVHLLQTLCTPALEEGAFLRKYVEAEKTTVRKRLDSVVNDKVRYAAERCNQEMFKNDPFRFHALGIREEIDCIDAASLYDRYRQWIGQAQIDLYVAGDTTLELVQTIVNKHFTIDRGEIAKYAIGSDYEQSRDSVNIVVEQLDVNQGKLNMGFRVPVLYTDADYPAALVYNGVLGSYPHSKLFANVREKESLAYYASSRLDGYKGMLMIQSGIEMEKFDKAVTIIKEQIGAISGGEISDRELAQTKAMMTNQLREVNDSAFEMIAFDFNSVVTGKLRTMDSLIEEIESVTRADLVAVANKVRLDTIYFLRDRKGERQA